MKKMLKSTAEVVIGKFEVSKGAKKTFNLKTGKVSFPLFYEGPEGFIAFDTKKNEVKYYFSNSATKEQIKALEKKYLKIADKICSMVLCLEDYRQGVC